MTAGSTRTIGSSSDTASTPDNTGMGDENSFSRRRALAMCSLGLLGAAGLAACGGGSDASSDSAASAASAASPAGTVLAKLSDVPVGGAIAVATGGKSILVSQPTKGTAAAFSAVCPHQGGQVVVDGKILRCVLHNSTFKEADGSNISGPAAGQPLPTVKVTVTGGNVITA